MAAFLIPESSIFQCLKNRKELRFILIWTLICFLKDWISGTFNRQINYAIWNYRKFSYAKYYGGELTDKFGDFNYNFYIDTYQPEEGEFTTRKLETFEHLIYHTRENNYVIVSRKLFLLSIIWYHFLTVCVLFSNGFNPAIYRHQKISPRRIVIDLNLKFRLPLFLLFCIAVTGCFGYYILQCWRVQIETPHDLNEKMKSISEEIDLRLEDKDELRLNWLTALQELAKLSNIFEPTSTYTVLMAI